MAIWWLLMYGLWWKVTINQSDVDSFRVMVALAVLNGWFDRPYVRQVPVTAGEIGIDEEIDEQKHNAVRGIIFDQDAADEDLTDD